MSKGINPSTPVKAIEALARIYQHCEGVDSAPCDLWIVDDRGRVVLEMCDAGTVQKARRAVELLGGWARSLRKRTVYRYRSESGGWYVTAHKIEGTEPRSYEVYQTVFRLPRRLLMAIQLDLDDVPGMAA